MVEGEVEPSGLKRGEMLKSLNMKLEPIIWYLGDKILQVLFLNPTRRNHLEG